MRTHIYVDGFNLADGFDNAYDAAIVISNDMDLLEPVRLVRAKLGKKVGLLCPQDKVSRALRLNTDFFKPIRESVLAASQYPDEISDAHGTFTKPHEW